MGNEELEDRGSGNTVSIWTRGRAPCTTEKDTVCRTESELLELKRNGGEGLEGVGNGIEFVFMGEDKSVGVFPWRDIESQEMMWAVCVHSLHALWFLSLAVKEDSLPFAITAEV